MTRQEHFENIMVTYKEGTGHKIDEFFAEEALINNNTTCTQK